MMSFALLAASQLSAQQTDSLLNPVTVTSTVSPLEASRTGRNLIVIKGDYFQHLPVNSIDELLRYVPGIEVQARGPMGTQSDITMRGGTYQQVLVIVDGLRLNDPNTGHFSTYIPIAPSEIERIEVLKGASSAIYGSDAVGGVINIITKTFARRQEGKQHSATGQVAAGSYGTLTANAGGFYSNGQTAVSLGYLTNNASGQPQRGLNGYLHNNTVSASVSHNFSPAFNLSFRSSFDRRDFAAQNYYTTFLSDTATEVVRTLYNQLKLTYTQKRSTVSLNAGYKTVKDQYAYNKVSIANENTTRLLQGLALYEYKAGNNLNLASGVQFQHRQIASNDRGNHTVKQLAGFVTLQANLTPALSVVPAVRLDWDENAGTELVPQLNAAYRFIPVHLRGSIGKTIRQADFTERYNNYNKPLVTGGSIGNPNLQAERSLSYEAGADLVAIRHLKVAATYFRKNYSRLIDWVTTPYSQMPRKDNLVPTGTYALAQNISDVMTRGVEADIQYIYTMSKNRQLYATAGFLWLQSTTGNAAAPSFYISSHAKVLTNCTLLYTDKRFSASVNGLYKSRETRVAPAINAAISKDYFVMNCRADYFVLQNVGVYIQADNVFNKTYSDLLGAVMPGRWLMGGLKFRL